MNQQSSKIEEQLSGTIRSLNYADKVLEKAQVDRRALDDEALDLPLLAGPVRYFLQDLETRVAFCGVSLDPNLEMQI